jgi:uncharacterized BrkB/YihY/UPF0761 family membrane protein
MTIKAKTALTSAYRWSVVARTGAAAIGGFLLTSSFSVWLALILWQWLGVSRLSAVSIATLSSFLLWSALITWCFYTYSVRQAWLGMLVPAAVLATLSWLLFPGEFG